MRRAHPVVTVLVGPTDDDPPGLDALDGRADVRVVRTSGQLRDALPDTDVLAVYDFATTLVHEAGDDVAGLEWVHAASAGVDAVLSPQVLASETVVTNARGVFDDAMAEYALALLLLFTKDLRRTLDLQAAGEWRHRTTDRLAGRRLLVVGAGSIGRAVARLAAAVGMEVHGIARRSRDDDADFVSVSAADELLDRLEESDDVVVCTPLTPDTRGLFGADAFAAMKRGSRFVNLGRGSVVDEGALLAALDAGQVDAAGLDVFVDEPLPAHHPFWRHPRVVVSPHMSGDEHEWRAALTRQFIGNVERWQRGQVLDDVVDKQGLAAPVRR